MTSLVDKIVLCHKALLKNKIPHAFGGALALAWCTRSARGTIDIDINIFVSADHADQTKSVFTALPASVKYTDKDIEELMRETQVRLWWDSTPLDIFLNSTPYHEQVHTRIRWESFSDHKLPFLCCRDVGVFKAFFNRTKDWADLEEMQTANTLDIEFIADVLKEYLGEEDERLDKLNDLAGINSGGQGSGQNRMI